MTTATTRVVSTDGRRFTVKIGEDGRPLSIKERRLFHPGRPWECWGHVAYWHHSHGLPKTGRGKRLGRPSLVREVLGKAGVDTRQLAGH